MSARGIPLVELLHVVISESKSAAVVVIRDPDAGVNRWNTMICRYSN
jgi:hypothetical protein